MAGPGVCSFEPCFHHCSMDTLGQYVAALCLERRCQLAWLNVLSFLTSTCHNGRLLFFVSNDRDCWIGVHFIVEGVGVVHAKEHVNTVSRGNKLPQFCPILVTHPSISTDKCAYTAGLQLPKRCFKKSHIEISSTAHRRICIAVDRGRFFWNILKSYVWRVPDNEISLSANGI